MLDGRLGECLALPVTPHCSARQLPNRTTTRGFDIGQRLSSGTAPPVASRRLSARGPRAAQSRRPAVGWGSRGEVDAAVTSRLRTGPVSEFRAAGRRRGCGRQPLSRASICLLRGCADGGGWSRDLARQHRLSNLPKGRSQHSSSHRPQRSGEVVEVPEESAETGCQRFRRRAGYGR